MIKGIESILIGSENATKLAKFYREIVGFAQTGEFEMGENNEMCYMFENGGVSLAIMDHSEVKGKNKNPERLIINFEVADIEKEVDRLKMAKVTQKQEIYHIEGYGYVSTFIDVDGNFFQLVQVRAAN